MLTVSVEPSLQVTGRRAQLHESAQSDPIQPKSHENQYTVVILSYPGLFVCLFVCYAERDKWEKSTVRHKVFI